MPAMALTMHAAEDLVAAVRSGRVATTAAVIDQALACLDLVARWVDAFEATGRFPPTPGRRPAMRPSAWVACRRRGRRLPYRPGKRCPNGQCG